MSTSQHWSVPSLPVIENANTSGQGYCAAHRNGALAQACLDAGYTYSHSVPVTCGDWKRVVHCFKLFPGAKDEHNVSFCDAADNTSQSWGTSVSCGSGRKHAGFGASALARHLASKARRLRRIGGAS